MDTRRMATVVVLIAGLACGALARNLGVEHRGAALEDLPLEHRGALAAPLVPALPDITSNLPAASPNLFIWTDSDGTYRFGMQSEDQWRVESRDASGLVQGRYVYRTPDGQTVDVSYDAGPQGFRARGDAIPGGAAPLIQDDAPVILPWLPPIVDTGAEEEDERVAVPYGALRLSGQEETRPAGNGINTYSDEDTLAIVTDINEQKAANSAHRVLYPVLGNVLGQQELVVGPPIIGNQPVQPAAILV